MKISVGDYWLTRGGHIVEVTEYNEYDPYPYCFKLVNPKKSSKLYSVDKKGQYFKKDASMYDFIEKVTSETHPEYFI